MTFTREDTRAVKAAAAIWMCFHHLFAFPDRFPAGVTYISMLPGNLEYTLGHVGKICVAMFVCMSGFGTYLALAHADHPWKTAFRKIGGLYRKYWAVFLVFIPIALALRVPRVTPRLWDFAANFTALHTDYNGEWWFLSPFLVLMAFSPLLVGLVSRTRRDWIWWIAAVAGHFLLPTIWYDSESVTANFHNALVFVPGFWLGCLMAKERIFDRWLARVGPWPSLGILAVLIAARCFFNERHDALLAPVLCAATAGMLRGLPRLRKVMGEIGTVSTEIWLTHSFFCYHFIPEIVFAPRLSLLVTAWLVAMSYGTGKVLTMVPMKIKTASR